MKPPANSCLLTASAIDLNDRTYVLSPEVAHPSPQLINSIREYGILHPPVVLQRKHNRFIVVAGRKRLETAITILNEDIVPCIVVHADSPRLYLYSLLLEQSLIGTPFSLAEQIAFFADLLKTCTTDDALPLLEKLGYKASTHKLEELLALRELGSLAMLALHRGTLTFASARKLHRLSQADQEELIALITKFHLGGSKQQKLIDLSTELLLRDKKCMADIAGPFLKKLDIPRQENIPQQGATLLSSLHEQCFPRSTLAENEFSKRVAQLNLPGNMHIGHSPSFEDDSVTLALNFANWESMQKVFSGIRQLLAR